MKKIFVLLLLTVVFGACCRQNPIEGVWEFSYFLPSEEVVANEDDESVAIFMMMTTIVLSDFSYRFEDGVVIVCDSEKDSDGAKGSYDTKKHSVLLPSDNDSCWSFSYEIKGDSMYLENDEIRLVFVRL